MALNKPALEAGILSLLTDLSTRTDNPAQARQDFAAQLATLVERYVKSGTVNSTVATTGTATQQTGTAVGSIT